MANDCKQSNNVVNVVTQITKRLDNPDYIHALSMAVGHIHDCLYEYEGGSMSFATDEGEQLTVECITEPDGICIVDDDSLILIVERLDKSTLDVIPEGTIIPDKIISQLAQTATCIYEVMVEHGYVPEMLFDYG